MELIKDLIKYALVILFVIFLKIYIISPIQINGESMEPTLLDKDFLILNKIAYVLKEPQRFDIVVVKYDEPAYLVKRIIALPGESVEYKDSVLYINGEVVEESMITETTDDYGPVTVPEGSYFVVGDNRDNSVDSRMDVVGFVPIEEIDGKAFLRLFPFNKIGTVN